MKKDYTRYNEVGIYPLSQIPYIYIASAFSQIEQRLMPIILYHNFQVDPENLQLCIAKTQKAGEKAFLDLYNKIKGQDLANLDCISLILDTRKQLELYQQEGYTYEPKLNYTFSEIKDSDNFSTFLEDSFLPFETDGNYLRIHRDFLNQIFVCAALANLTYETIDRETKYDLNGKEIPVAVLKIDFQNQASNLYGFYKVMEKVILDTSNYLIHQLHIPENLIHSNIQPIGLESYTYPDYEEIIPEPIPLDWLKLAEYTQKQIKKYQDYIINKNIDIQNNYEIET